MEFSLKGCWLAYQQKATLMQHLRYQYFIASESKRVLVNCMHDESISYLHLFLSSIRNKLIQNDLHHPGAYEQSR